MSTSYSNIDVDESEDEVSSAAVTINWLNVINLTTSVLFLKMYDGLAADVVVGTTVPKFTFPIPAQADNNGGGFTLTVQRSMQFTKALTVAATTGIAITDIGSPGTNGLVLNLTYDSHI